MVARAAESVTKKDGGHEHAEWDRVWGVVSLGALVATLAAGVMLGCAHKIVMEPTKFQMGVAVVKTTGDLAGVQKTFRTGDEQAVAWVEFANAHGDHTARFRWFNERDELVLDTGPLAISPGAGLYAYRRVWSILPIRGAPAQLMPGDWHVEVLFNDKKVETLKFTLKQS